MHYRWKYQLLSFGVFLFPKGEELLKKKDAILRHGGFSPGRNDTLQDRDGSLQKI